MIGLVFIALAVLLAALVEIVVPGRALYHQGWYNVALVALALLAVPAMRRTFSAHAGNAARIAIGAAVLGIAICALATVASGLFGPDERTIVGAPGQRVPDDDLGGTLVFPLAGTDAQSLQTVQLVRGSGPPVNVGPNRRDVGSAIVDEVPRDVVAVTATDVRGGHLTITQPTGTAFLSPVLLMQQHQQIGEYDLPFDSFAVPAAHRLVKAVLFNPLQAATLRAMQGIAVSAVLFAVDDENDRPLRNAIVLAPNRQTVTVAGIQLRPDVLSYPAVRIVSAPPALAVVAGAILICGGLLTFAFAVKGSAAR